MIVAEAKLTYLRLARDHVLLDIDSTLEQLAQAEFDVSSAECEYMAAEYRVRILEFREIQRQDAKAVVRRAEVALKNVQEEAQRKEREGSMRVEWARERYDTVVRRMGELGVVTGEL